MTNRRRAPIAKQNGRDRRPVEVCPTCGAVKTYKPRVDRVCQNDHPRVLTELRYALPEVKEER